MGEAVFALRADGRGDHWRLPPARVPGADARCSVFCSPARPVGGARRSPGVTPLPDLRAAEDEVIEALATGAAVVSGTGGVRDDPPLWDPDRAAAGDGDRAVRRDRGADGCVQPARFRPDSSCLDGARRPGRGVA